MPRQTIFTVITETQNGFTRKTFNALNLQSETTLGNKVEKLVGCKDLSKEFVVRNAHLRYFSDSVFRYECVYHAVAQRWFSVESLKPAQRSVVYPLKFVMHKYPSMTFRLSYEQLKRLDVLARAKNRSRSQVIRDAIDLAFRIIGSTTKNHGDFHDQSDNLGLLPDLLPELAGIDGIQTNRMYEIDISDTEIRYQD